MSLRFYIPVFGRILLFGMCLAFCHPVSAAGAAAPSVSVNPTFKITGLFSRNAEDEAFYPAGSIGVGLYRLRFDVTAHFGSRADALFSYEQSGYRASTDNYGAGTEGILPASGDIPYRITQLSREYIDKDRFSATHELDRGYVSFHPRWGEITIGRQAIGLGRGRIFSAVDMFAPFSPLEIDREWRGGVDAARAEYVFTPVSGAEAIAVFGHTRDDSAVIARLQSYLGEADAEVLCGKRAKDGFAGIVLSSVLGNAEIHGEYAVFHTEAPHPQGGQLWGDDCYISTAVFGSSYTFAAGNGLHVLGEYHYSGFGAGEIRSAASLYSQDEYSKRYLRGDMQILGRHALGFQTSYPWNESVNLGVDLFIAPRDGSGLVSPSVRWDFSQAGSFIAAGYAPWGTGSQNAEIGSEYGSYPSAVFLQVSFYL